VIGVTDWSVFAQEKREGEISVHRVLVQIEIINGRETFCSHQVLSAAKKAWAMRRVRLAEQKISTLGIVPCPCGIWQWHS
jgi:hypothetical protein